jgi:hypothetical protein
MVVMMERFEGPGSYKKEMPSNEGVELTAVELADAMKAARTGREEFRGGEINTEELRDALSRAMKDPVSL